MNNAQLSSAAFLTRAIMPGIAGTTAMTAFSYLVSAMRDKQFREPELLEGLMKNLEPQLEIRHSKATAWVIHYLVGCLFSSAYYKLAGRSNMISSFVNGVVLGASTGMIGMKVWKEVFRLHPYPPVTDYKNYYRHLFVAHLVFGIFTAKAQLLAKDAA